MYIDYISRFYFLLVFCFSPTETGKQVHSLWLERTLLPLDQDKWIAFIALQETKSSLSRWKHLNHLKMVILFWRKVWVDCLRFCLTPLLARVSFAAELTVFTLRVGRLDWEMYMMRACQENSRNRTDKF